MPQFSILDQPPPNATFATLVNFHFNRGTSPDNSPLPTFTGRWTNELVAFRIGVNRISVGLWRTGKGSPRPINFVAVLTLFFGKNYEASASARDLIRAYNKNSPYSISIEEQEYEQEALKQIPAAFRFGINNGKIDALAEQPAILDSEISHELYGETKEKLAALVSWLDRSNSDPYVSETVHRLLTKLGSYHSEVRPGVILSKLRSLEAIRDAYNTPEARLELFPDAISKINDVCLTTQDFLSTFPTIREIERERVALGIERNLESIEPLEKQAKIIQVAASQASEAVTEAAKEALSENDLEIQRAEQIQLRAGLIADKLLVVRNFVSEAVRLSWEVIGPDFKDGARVAARLTPPLALLSLVAHVAGPVAALAGLVPPTFFRSLAGVIQSRKDHLQKINRKY